MRLKLKKLELDAGRPVAFIQNKTAEKLNVHAGDRIEIIYNGRKIVAVTDLVKKSLTPEEIFLSKEIIHYLKLKPGSFVDVYLSLEPASTSHILKKLSGKPLNKKEIFTVVKDIVDNALTEGEVAYFVSGIYEHGMSLEETINLTDAIYRTGKSISWSKNKKIIDKHSIGGIAGNRTTPIVVSICAAAGVTMPKTSSRAITSAAGTADVMETLTKVDLSIPELTKVVNKTNACLVWGGALGMAPADDKLIRVERLLSLDPQSQLIASIMAKKLSVGSKYILIDIPYGKFAKVSRQEALALKNKFLQVGNHFKLKMKIELTKGDQPIGNGIGPILEMKDVLRVLQRNNSPEDLEEKSIFLASKILEMTGKAKPSDSKALAKSLLDSGKAYEKFQKIINAQGKIKAELREARFKHEIKAKSSGRIKEINNKQINYLCRILGCPADKPAGVYLHKHSPEPLKKGESIITLYSESRKKLSQGIEYFRQEKPVVIG